MKEHFLIKIPNTSPYFQSKVRTRSGHELLLGVTAPQMATYYVIHTVHRNHFSLILQNISAI